MLRTRTLRLALPACFALPVFPQGTTTRVSVASNGVPSSLSAGTPDLSADGAHVVFDSSDPELVPGDRNGHADIFRHDRTTGATILVSVATDGRQANAYCFSPRVSRDGRFVVFVSAASSLDPLDTNGEFDVFLRDCVAGTCELASLGAGGALGDGGSFEAPDVSDDGRFVVFGSIATNLVAGDTNGLRDVFVRDRVAATTTRVSVGPGGVESDRISTEPRLSGDGRFALFTSYATTFVVGDTSANADVFAYELATGAVTHVSASLLGGCTNGESGGAVASADGRWIAFSSGATDLVASDANGAIEDVYVRDTVLGTTERVSLSQLGVQVAGRCAFASISDDGRHVAFASAGLELVGGGGPTFVGEHLFVRDRQLSTTTLVSQSTAGAPATDHSAYASISEDGVVLAFRSRAPNLVIADINGAEDIFVRDANLSMQVTTYCTAKTNSLGCQPVATWAGVPSIGGADNFFVVAVDELTGKVGVFFWGLAPAAVPFKNGWLCVQPPFKRSGVMHAGGVTSTPWACTGSYSFAFDHAYVQAQGLNVGQTIYGQFWSRDSGFLPPLNVALSNAIAFTLAP